MADQVRINGVLHSWASTVVKIDGERYTGITKVAFADSRERVLAYGQSRAHAPRGQTAGKYSVEPLALTMHKDSAEALREQLAAKSSTGTSYGNAIVEVVVQFLDADTPITVELEGCRWTKTSESNEESPDALLEDIEFQPTLIRRNGRVLFDDTQQ